MFSEFGPQMVAMGWSGLIPLLPGLKRPAIRNWQRYNKVAPSPEQLARWARSTKYGIGLTFGPDAVAGVDLDWTDPDLAAAAWEITRSILGDTPLIRIGLPPKRLGLYRLMGKEPVMRSFGSFDVFTRSGQAVMYGVHPATGSPYQWIEQSPATVGPADLPPVTAEQLWKMILELERLDPAATARHRARGSAAARQAGPTTELLRALGAHDNPLAEAERLLATAPHGKRHNTLVGVTIALATLGYSDHAIRYTLCDIFDRLMPDQGSEENDTELENAIAWARKHIGPDDATILADPSSPLTRIEDDWLARWGKSP